jgi:hypothetical protein
MVSKSSPEFCRSWFNWALSVPSSKYNISLSSQISFPLCKGKEQLGLCGTVLWWRSLVRTFSPGSKYLNSASESRSYPITLYPHVCQCSSTGRVVYGYLHLKYPLKSFGKTWGNVPGPELPIVFEVGISGRKWHPTAVIRIALKKRMQNKNWLQSIRTLFTRCREQIRCDNIKIKLEDLTCGMFYHWYPIMVYQLASTVLQTVTF